MSTHEKEMWEMIYNLLGDYLDISERSINLWFGKMELRYLTDSAAYFSIDNYNKQQIVQKIYMDGFTSAVKSVLGFEPEIKIICCEKESFEDQFAEIIYGDKSFVKGENQIPGNQGYENTTPNETSEITQDESDDGIPELSKYKAKLGNLHSGTDREYAMQGFHGINPEETLRKTNLQSVPVMADKSAKLEMHNVPKRYNTENDTIEVVPLSKYYDDLKSKNGMMILSPGAPMYNANYTFENFVVGESNKLAYHYCYQVSQYPAKQYNPLFIYGNSGLGKTHLLYAITNEIEKLHPSMNIVYIKGDDFTNELVDAISSKNTRYFKDKYRNADIFLMDDVQFIAGKNSTQEEFFHTYESLFRTGKQIIMTCDVAPHRIKNLEDRLRSRFVNGIVCTIDTPDTELITAIFKNKAAAMGVSIPNDVLMFLAQTVNENVRQIEGLIKKLNSISLLENRPVDMDLARKCVSDIADIEVSIDENTILKVVSEKYGIEVDAILGKKRTKDIMHARHMAVYLTRKLTDLSLTDIGRIFNRDHSTIMSSVESVKCESDEDSKVKKEIESLIDAIRTNR